MLAALLLLPPLAAGFLRKCCSEGESLSEDLVCGRSKHSWAYANISHGLADTAGCQLGYADRETPAHCIDNLLGTDRVVKLLCPDRNDTFPVPDVHYLRKCCPSRRTYDSRIQTCWGEQPDSAPTAFLNMLMFNAAAPGVIDLLVGAPECEPDKVVVDHLVYSENIRRLQSASIAYKLGDQEYIMNPDEVCVDRTELRDVLVVRACEDQNFACLKHTCIRKCCPDGMSFYTHNNCSNSNRMHPKPIRIVNKTGFGIEPIVFRSPAYWYGGLLCEKYLEGPSSDYTLDSKGNIYSASENLWTEMGYFCVEYAFWSGDFDEYLFFCFPEEGPKPEIQIWDTVAMILSSFFLLLTFLVYAALPSLKNLHGKTLMCHVLSLFVAYSSLSTVRLITDQLLSMICVLLGYVTVFSFLASFFWLNVISFDIWWTFGSMRPTMDRRKRECRRFVLYSIYAWASPCFITALILIAQRGSWVPANFRPGIGTDSCWFSQESKAIFIFFIFPVGMLLIVNLFFFIQTARHCSQVRSDLNKVGRTAIADKKFQSDRNRLVMSSKLFIAMGINWVLEFLSAISIHLGFIPNQVWFLSDMVNASGGLVIFCIFVLKKRIMREVAGRLEGMLCRSRPPPRQPSVSTLFSGNNTTYSTSCGDSSCARPMKKSVSESRLSPLPQIKKTNLASQKKSKSANRLLP